jgi:hypothetical protein
MAGGGVIGTVTAGFGAMAGAAGGADVGVVTVIEGVVFAGGGVGFVTRMGGV